MTVPRSVEGAVQAERARAHAVVARDTARLATHLDDGLAYVDATGTRQDKTGFLQFVETGPAFPAVEFEVAEAMALGSGAMLLGRLHLALRRAGDAEIVEARSWATAVWLRGADGHWRLRAFQSTRAAA
ncbi:nuclear transport factor 2 family protein [Ramlibacter terrae]|uniref:Nuclear transport factor 2 family protein n=1 Tax=Ramlibacter terrae TaxID=2732511 RepID=A0ABX6P5K7_9BURK|nr:nuclear transport factor 2 family protein [Ramlibacter terrae]